MPAIVIGGLCLSGCAKSSSSVMVANSGISRLAVSAKVSHLAGSFTNRGQDIRIHEVTHEMVIHLKGLEKFRDNSPLDSSVVPERLQIHVPLGWTVRMTVPRESGYRAFVTPSSATNRSFNGSVEQLLDASKDGYASLFRASVPGAYNLMIMRPGQKGGHIVDLLIVSKTSVPAVQSLTS
ncbi:hypothetical protein [Alicyclobacillus mengziensis]|uniref:Uncharacterized protein n=1 Tax=Alicyclobacillus mengziensis TaxID=2931921 RepID=A0A9X7Z9A6_9BACL|nr:hypothetical protein [Alicyclobacillus mengziensis]QSO49415.1 hypothetical protein JZ786_11110 [Alicyclobacillus mengziensis]